MSFYQDMIWPSLKVTLLIIAAAFVNVSYAEETDQQLLAKGMWHDPKTNLIWTRCLLGEQWTGSSCVGDKIKYTWHGAIEVAKLTKYAEHTDWRVPRIDELYAVKVKSESDKRSMILPSPLCKPDNSSSFYLWSSSTNTGWKATAYFIKYMTDEYAIPNICYLMYTDYSDKSNKYYVRLVRSSK